MKHSLSTVLVVGMGSIGKRHIRIIRRDYPAIKIVVLRRKKCNEKQDELSKVFRCVTSLEEAISIKPDAAIIASPATKHVSVAKELACHGIHLMVEKPISNNSQDSQELVDICSQNNVLLVVGYNLRFLPSLIYFRQCIQSNLVGNVYSVRSEIGQYLPSWRPGSDYRDGVSANKSLGGGVLLELSHEIDYLEWIFGEVEWVQSYTSRLGNLEINVDDSAHVLFGFKEGRSKTGIASMDMDFIRHDTTRRCYAIGDKGTLLWDGISGEVSLFSEGENHWKLLFSPDAHQERDYTYAKELNVFFKSIDSGSRSVASGQEGVRTIQIVEAIEESNTVKSRVYL